MKYKLNVIVASVLFGLGASQLSAQSGGPLRAAVEKAVTSSPDVAARYNAYRAAVDSIDVARGGYFPRLDLSADVGTERSTFKNADSSKLNRGGVGLSLTQLLWDGMNTSNTVSRAGHEKLSRYFELLDATEQTALEAARAHYDVQRYRKLVELAEDNYLQHRGVADKIQARLKAGVGSGVDLEQVKARVSLAESNLAAELANLHDVSARYQRIVGELPPKGTVAPELLSGGLPFNAGNALNMALNQSSAVSAAIENLRAARDAAKSTESSFQPKVEARVRAGGGHNYNSLEDRKTETVAEVVLNWNLFNGGADRARARQQANLVNQAADQRDKACRDVRQTAAIAFNDTQKLGEQVSFLKRNTEAIESALAAYRQQFDISRRSLLDLLNAENETYTARRALANAEYDQAVSFARTHAALNQLTGQLGLAKANKAGDEAAGWSAAGDAAGRCPAQVVDVPVVNASTLSQRMPAAAPVVAPVVQQPAAPASLATPQAPVPLAPAEAGVAISRVNAWAAAWQSKDFARYESFYAPNFTGSEDSNAAWKAKRKALVTKKGPISVKLASVSAFDVGSGMVDTRFRQTYKSSNYQDRSEKVLTWQQIGNQWLIVKESNR